jgi:hypothetical protein
MFSPSVAQILGVKLRNGKRRIFRGLGGAVEAYVHRLHFNIGSLRFYARVAFATVEIPNIVGRLDIMKNVDAIFRDERELSLKSPSTAGLVLDSYPSSQEIVSHRPKTRTMAAGTVRRMRDERRKRVS